VFPDHGNAELTGRGAGRGVGTETETLAAVRDTPWRPGGAGEDGVRPRRGAAREPAATEVEAAESAEPAAAGEETPPPRGRRRALSAIGGAALVVALLAWLGTLGSVQTILRQSFTKLPTPYTEMYFSGTPTVSGITLSVPVTVVNHATSQDSFTLEVWTTDAAGKADTTTPIKVTPKHGEATVVVKVAVQMPADAQVLWINLAGQPQTLHYRIAGEAIPSSTATPTPTAKH